MNRAHKLNCSLLTCSHIHIIIYEMMIVENCQVSSYVTISISMSRSRSRSRLWLWYDGMQNFGDLATCSRINYVLSFRFIIVGQLAKCVDDLYSDECIANQINENNTCSGAQQWCLLAYQFYACLSICLRNWSYAKFWRKRMWDDMMNCVLSFQFIIVDEAWCVDDLNLNSVF